MRLAWGCALACCACGPAVLQEAPPPVVVEPTVPAPMATPTCVVVGAVIDARPGEAEETPEAAPSQQATREAATCAAAYDLLGERGRLVWVRQVAGVDADLRRQAELPAPQPGPLACQVVLGVEMARVTGHAESDGQPGEDLKDEARADACGALALDAEACRDARLGSSSLRVVIENGKRHDEATIELVQERAVDSTGHGATMRDACLAAIGAACGGSRCDPQKTRLLEVEGVPMGPPSGWVSEGFFGPR